MGRRQEQGEPQEAWDWFRSILGVFTDEWAIVRSDPDHHEDRWIIVGAARYLVIVVAVYTHRHEAIRIISARKATAKERRYYEKK